jgi:hypothetical protein
MRRRLLGLAAGAVLTVLAGGCVNLPTTGAANNGGPLPDTVGLTQQGVDLTPVPPGAQWLPAQIVRGFLAATGATWNGQQSSLSVAREYLTGGYASHWRPTPAATVIDTAPAVSQIQFSPHVTGGQAAAQVSVTSEHLSTLVSANANEAGSIEESSLPKPYVYDFDLIQTDGKWRISSITGPGITTTKPGVPDDDSIMLLENSDFLRDYQPRNLYFPAVATPHTLVPFPVYTLGIQPLADGLTSLPPARLNWLYRSVTTAFSPGTKLPVQVQAHSYQAIVDLDGKAARGLTPARLRQMEAQLVWTLTSAPYSAGSGIQTVTLQIGNKAISLLPSDFASWVPGQASGSLYFQMPGANDYPDFDVISTAAATAAIPPKKGTTPYVTQIRPSKLGTGPLTAVAVSPPSGDDALREPIFAGCRDKTVYVAQLGLDSTVTTQAVSAPCTSLSWDGNGYLWVTTQSDVFRIKVSASGLTPATIALAVQLAPNDTFTTLKVAPDGVRVAMIIKHGRRSASVDVTSISQRSKSLIYLAQNQHFLAVGPELTDPVALSWWGTDHLLVLDQKADGTTELYEVPLNGGESMPYPTPPGALSVAANGSSVAVGTDGDSGPAVKVERDLGGTWHRIGGASSPAYPG